MDSKKEQCIDGIQKVAERIYSVLKNQIIEFSFEEGTGPFTRTLEGNLSLIDKATVSLLLGSLVVKGTDAYNIMERVSIDFDSILYELNLPDEVHKKVEDIAYSDCEVETDYVVGDLVQVLSDNFYYLCSETLVEGLWDKNIGGSKICGALLSLVCEKHSPFSGESAAEFLYRSSAIKTKEYLEKHPEAKKKENNQQPGLLSTLFDGVDEPDKGDPFEKFGTYLTEKEYEFSPVFGREEELKKLIISLLTIDESPMIIGNSGVGKTALVEGLAYLIQKGDVPENLKNKKIWMTSSTALVSGCKYLGMFEERMKDILDKLEKDGDTILFLDEIHTAIGTGAPTSSPLDLVNILKSYLSNGRITMIGVTTKEEYNEHIVSDGAFGRRFSLIEVKEPTREILYKILEGSLDRYESESGVRFDFNDVEMRKIFNCILDVTNPKSIVYTDKAYNPDISLSILKKAFAIAQYNGNESVTMSDVAEAIMSCDRIYQHARERKANQLKAETKVMKKVNRTPRIIKFEDCKEK